MSHIALSYSRLSTYMQCPHKFKRQYITKDYPYPDEENFFFIKGSKIHKQLENYVQCKLNPTIIPLRYDGVVENCFPMIDMIFNQGYTIIPEQKLAVTKDFKKCEWFDKETAWRAIVDLTCIKNDVALIIDWKSGKCRSYSDTNTGQLHLTASIIFSIYKNINFIKTAYVYVEHKQTDKRQFTREMYEQGLLEPFKRALITVNTDTEFKAKKNQYCKWCDINKAKECPL